MGAEFYLSIYMYIFLYLLYWNSIYMVETIIISTVVVTGLINIQIV